VIETHPADELLRAECRETLRRAFGRGIERARDEGRSILVSAVVPGKPFPGEPDVCRPAASGLPLSPRALFGQSRATGDGFYWERPADCLALAATGTVRTLTGSGAACLAQVEGAWQTLLAKAVVHDVEAGRSPAESGMPLAGPMLLGGAAFDPLHEPSRWWDGFPAARFVVPRYMLAAQGSERWLTVNAMVDPDTQLDRELATALHGLNMTVFSPSGDEVAGELSGVPRSPSGAADGSTRRMSLAARRYQDLVRLAREAIRHGDAEKIVLARAMTLAGTFSPERTLGELRRVHPGCTLFAVRQGASCFLGATPEGLVRRQGRTVAVSALAGTAGRGATPDEDARLAADLLASHKDQEEHAVVVRMIRESLAPVCDQISVPPEPVVLRLRTVQHLSTPITGHLHGDTCILSLVRRLHPTPAVGGFPREAALRFLRRHEGLDRGWYAGAIGWVNHAGDGDFVVAIRSTLLLPKAAVLFAGCGVMADSDPASEYAESCLKLDSIRCFLVPSLDPHPETAVRHVDRESTQLPTPERE
jgi:isochorismate synthase